VFFVKKNSDSRKKLSQQPPRGGPSWEQAYLGGSGWMEGA